MASEQRVDVAWVKHLGLAVLVVGMVTIVVAPASPQEAKKSEAKAQPQGKAKAEDKAGAKDKKDSKAAADKKDEKKEKKEDDAKVPAVQAAPAVQAVPAVGMAQMAVPLAPGMPAPPGAAPPNPDGEFTDGITLPTDRQVKKQLEAAEQDYIKEKRWDAAAQLLQKVLDRKEDLFVQVRRKSGDQKEKVRWVSARAEANRLLGTMPADGLAFYELRYGGIAKEKLTQAKKESDPQLLAEVSQRYFHTDAGAEATDLLGTYFLDRGERLMAAQCYDRLLRREGGDKLPPFTLLKAALAFRMSGDAVMKKASETTMQRLASSVGADGLRIGDETFTLDQIKKELERGSLTLPVSPFDWVMYRGNASRSAVGRGSAPFLESTWKKNTIKEPFLDHYAQKWIEDAHQRNIYQTTEPMLPAFFPIAASGKLIFRSYKTIHAVDIRTGEEVWSSIGMLAGLDALAKAMEKNNQVEQWLSLYIQGGHQNVLFENSTVGTLSTDNSRVYAVDDVAVPPHPTVQMQMGWGGGQQLTGAMAQLAQHSRLVAIELETGKLAWELGDPASDHSELADSYFLGPPLPLGGKLYVLTEKNAELRLVCLEATKGQAIWTQTLATARDRLSTDVSRRVQAVHLSYAEGILVCPTNAGAILGVDLLSRSLVWAFPYREKSPNANGNQAGGMMGMGGRRAVIMPWGGQDPNANLQKLTGGWKGSAPIIEDGKVVFTAPDGNAIHCLNLRDGDSVWQAERRDDLYLAGIYFGKVFLVGKSHCRALNLSDGKPAWQIDTGLPSGQGVASGSFYYLPLQKGEVCKIDLEKGAAVSRSPAPKGETPGNLLFYDGEVISQNENGVTAYEQVDAMVAQVDRLLKENPGDPLALSKRGRLKLYQGNLSGAVADLRTAVSHHPSPELLQETRQRLYSTLSELLRQDFPAAEKYLDEYRELCKVPIPAGTPAEERKKLEEEGRQRQAGFLSLLAQGREGQGRVLEAFQAYLDFGTLADAHELISVLNDPGVRARPDVWARGRIDALIRKADATQRARLETEVTRRYQEARASKQPDALGRFVDTFGALFAVGREARLEFAEQLMAQDRWLEAEAQLHQLTLHPEDRRIEARATEALARLMTHKGLLEDAVFFYRRLSRDFADVAIRDGKTGQAIFAELATDKRFLSYLDDLVAPLLGGTVQAMEIPKGSQLVDLQLIPYEPRGERLPYAQRNRLAWSLMQTNGLSSFQFKLFDRDTNKIAWTFAAPSTRATYYYGNTPFPAYSQGHLAVIYLGHTVFGLDLVEKKKLWERELLQPDRFKHENPYNQMQYLLSLDKDGAMQMSDQQNSTRTIGQIGPVTSSYVCVQNYTGLAALDPVKGTLLWTRNDISPSTRVFGDSENVYLIDVRDDRSVGSARALRGRDGAQIEVPDFAAAYQHRQRLLGGRILVSENDPTGSLIVRLYDVATGTDVWKKTLAPHAVVLRVEDPYLMGVLEPSGQLTVVDLQSLQEIGHLRLLPSHLEKVNDGLLLQDSQQFFVLLNRAEDGNAQRPVANLVGLRSSIVNGYVYAFQKQNSKLSWYAHVPRQMVLLEQFEDMPMVVFSALNHEPVANVPGGFNLVAQTLTIDKRTGKRLYERSPRNGFANTQNSQFHQLRVDRLTGIIDLVSRNLTLRHFLTANTARISLNGVGQLPEESAAEAAPQKRVRLAPLRAPVAELAPDRH